MAKQTVAPNQINVFAPVKALTDATGAPATGVVAATAGLVIWYWRKSAPNVVQAVSPVVTNLGALDNAHVDWAFVHFQDGNYWCAIPDGAFTAGVGSVFVGLRATGISSITTEIVIEPLFKFQGQVDAATPTTTTFPVATIRPTPGDEVFISAGQGAGQTALVLSTDGALEATHLAWDATIGNLSVANSTALLIAGDGHRVNLDIAISTRSELDNVDLSTETSLITNRLPPVLSALGFMLSDNRAYNGEPLIGDGRTTPLQT